MTNGVTNGMRECISIMINWPNYTKPKNLKYAKWYEQLIVNAKARYYNLDYQELHHIIPRSLGGLDDQNNLVGLSLREHYIAHLLLWRMKFPNPYNEKMAHAYSFMSRLQGKASINNRLYEKARIECSRRGKTYEELYTPEQIERMHKARENRVIPPESLERMKQGQLNASKCPMPDHVKLQVGNRFRGRTDLNGENNGMFGRKHSEESKAKMRAALAGRKQTEEQKEKRRQTFKKTAKTCVHCGKTIAKHNYTKWHGDNCKLKSVDA